MKPVDPVVIDLLNEFLTHELTAVNQYWIHARMCENWGYNKLWEKIRGESIDEMKHADSLVARILYFDGVPNLQKLNTINALEKNAIKRLNEILAKLRELDDMGTWELFKGILVSEEEHADWLEAQLELIEQVGLPNYLATQI